MLLDLFTSCKWGPMNVAAFNGSAGAILRKKIVIPSTVKRSLFMLRATVNVRIQQGNSAITTANVTNHSMLMANTYMPLLIEDLEDHYISIRASGTAAGDLEITLISDTASWSILSA